MSTRTYTIDKTHSEATFQVRHLITRVRGYFTDFGGAIQFDEANPAQSSVDFTVQVASINTATADRDTHLRSDDFFSVEKYPTMTFVSTGITSKGGDNYDVAGDLTMRGVTKPVVLAMTLLGKAQDPWGNERLAVEGEVTLNRKDFGLNWNAALETGGFLVGDEVKVGLSIQATGNK
ncbi:MAG: polyisoprenoid-binding protein [Acidobacteria bacterium]|nr:polyisoprenoid-binding protein [Acidobacteriota bacterium]